MRNYVLAVLLGATLGSLIAPDTASGSAFLMVGPHAPKIGYTPHIGPVGFGHNSSQSNASAAYRDSYVLASDLRHAAESARKARCAQLKAEYVGRHGITTPEPLRGLHGCEKYRLDAAYWRQRREGVPAINANVAAATIEAVKLSVHDALFGS